MVHEQMTRFYQGFRRDAHPMAVMVGVVGVAGELSAGRQALEVTARWTED